MLCSKTPTFREKMEAWALQRCPLSQLERLEPIARDLMQAFTDHRPEAFVQYLNQPEALTAYTHLFAPQTYVRVEAALTHILQRLPAPPDRPSRVLDLGCGVGSAALAAYDTLLQWTGHAPEITGVDWSQQALDALKEIHPQAITQRADLRSFTPSGTYDIILSSFAFNEAFPNANEAFAMLLKLSEALSTDAPSFVLILEPADRLATPRLLALRPRLTQANLPLYAPCPHAHACPLIPSQHGICHDVRKFKPTRPTILLTRHLRKTVSEVKYTPLAFGRPNGPLAEGFGQDEFLRIIGPINRGKGVLETRVCMGDGRVRALEIPNAALSSERRHALLDRQRGDCAWLDGPLDLRKRIDNDATQRTADLRFLDEAPLAIEDSLDDDTFTFSI
ncbi:MAG: small ribosomal subunit Rsm22 family protein [bacterium]|nr:small ribosomal subunit Rsm22 family protein [bacterium]